MRHYFLSLVCAVLCLGVLSGCSGSSSRSSSGSPDSPGSPGTPITANNPAPTIASITPDSVNAGAPAQMLTLAGTGYMTGSSVTFNGTALQTTYMSSTTVQAAVPATALAAGQVASIVVSNPAPGGGSSAAVSYPIMSPTPSINGLSPSFVTQGAAASITVSGSGFEANSVVQWNGSARPTTFVSGTTLRANLTAADTANFATGKITVYNPGPGGSTTTPIDLVVSASKPTILSINPSTVTMKPGSTVPISVGITGSGFASNATVQANGQFFTPAYQSPTYISLSLPAALFASTGTLQIVVTNPSTPAVQSNPGTITIVAPTYSFSVQPNSAPAGSPDTKITIGSSNSNFTANSVVMWNATPLSTTFVNSNQLTAIIPAALLTGFTQASIQVNTPEAQDKTFPVQPFTTYLSLPINYILYNAKDGLIYASIPGIAGEGLGNSVAGIDPTTGVIQRTIFVGSEPNRMALSNDGKQLYVGLNGAGAIRQVDLTTGTANLQFQLGGGPGIYNPPYTAQSLAVLPGQANSIAVYANNGVVTIYDSGVARTKASSGLNVYFNSNSGSLAFGDSAAKLYLNSYTTSYGLYSLTIDSTGVSAASQLGTNGGGNTLQYDNGRLYLATGAVLDASTGNQLGQFSVTNTGSTSPVAAAGPIVSDSTLGKAWVIPNSFQTSGQVLAFDESSFNPAGSLPVTGIGANTSNAMPADLVRWGENGLAFHTASQLFVLQGPIVKDVSTSPANLAVSLQAPTAATTGTSFNYTVQVSNSGPNTAKGVTLTAVTPAAGMLGTVSSSQGSCSGAGVLYCNLGTINSGSSATITIAVTANVAGTLEATATISAISFDPDSTNNQASANVSVTGNAINELPTVTQVSPAMVQAGSSTFILTVDGTGFTSASTVLWNGTPLPTTVIGSGQLTATVDSSRVQQLGWAQISATTPAPGGGTAAPLPLHIYQTLSVPANAINYDPFTRRLYAALPSTSTALTGNSIVAIDPTNGNVGSPVLVGSEPNVFSETSSGNYLWIGLSGAKSLGRFNLKTQSLDQTIPLIASTPFNTGNVVAINLAAVPGSDSSLAVEISNNGGIGILDVAGNTGTFRSKNTGIYNGNNPVFADVSHFYAYDSYTSGAEFYRYSVDTSGATMIDGTTLNGFGGFGGKFAIDRGLVFGSNGGIVNPTTTPPTQIATLPLGSGPYNTGLYGSGVVPDAAQSKAFLIGTNTAGTALNFLERFDTQHFVLEQQISLPGGNITPIAGTRWGQDGLAYILPSTGSSQPTQIYLLRGPFVLPAEASSHPAPTVSSVDQSTIPAGAGNLYLTVAGTGFMPGAVVLWNGGERTTTYVDASHLKVAIATVDVATGQSVTLTTRNPGSSNSNDLTVTIQ